MKRTFYFASCMAVALFAGGEAHAFRLTPIRAQFEPTGSNANKIFTIENNSDQPATVQVSVMSRDVDMDGHETNKKVSGDFSIYPEQVVLQPHATRSVRVQWAGGADLAKEKAYRLIAEQLPVNLDRNPPKGGVVRFLVNYAGAIFVAPAGVKPDLKLESFKPVDQNGKKMAEMVFDNQGTRHALLEDLKVDFKNGKTLSGDKLDGVAGETIMAGQKRRLYMAWPTELSGSLSGVEFNYDKQAF